MRYVDSKRLWKTRWVIHLRNVEKNLLTSVDYWKTFDNIDVSAIEKTLNDNYELRYSNYEEGPCWLC